MLTDSVGRVVDGRYCLVARLARGGMGVTYRAWDLSAGCPVVVKMPRRPVDDEDGTKAAQLASRFVREIDAMRALVHEHIVPILHSGEDDGLPYVAMRFLPGGSLADHRKKDGPGFRPMEAGFLYFWLPAIAEALDYVHSRGVVHRDVKPANIFFDGFWWAFLGDFGIAKVFDTADGLEKGETLTGTHFATGTPEYMAPELLVSKAEPDGRADQYALAISVYEMISGSRPFAGESANIVVEHATMPVPPLDRRRLKIPQSLVSAVERGLAKKPGERFGSCREFAQAALADVTPHPNEPGFVRLLCPACRRILRMPQSAAGKTGVCPKCKKMLAVASDLGAVWRLEEAGMMAAGNEDLRDATTLSDGGVSRVSQVAAAVNPNPSVESGAEGESTLPAVPSAGVSWAVAVIVLVLSPMLSAAVSAWAGSQWWKRLEENDVAAINLTREQERKSHEEHVTAALDSREERLQEALAANQARKDEFHASLQEDAEAADEAQALAEEHLRKNQSELESVSTKLDAMQRLLASLEMPGVVTNSIGMRFSRVHPGRFVMGANGYDVSESPPHEVVLTNGFYLAVCEVRNLEWAKVMGGETDACDLPMHVTWTQAEAFCEKLSKTAAEVSEKRVYRLPTEAEWEYACRAGSNHSYSFGDDVSLLGGYAWFLENASVDRRGAQSVGEKFPNDWGFFDMHGNGGEWCSDWYGPYPDGMQTDPQGPEEGTVRVLRGGAWDVEAVGCRSTSRYWGANRLAACFRVVCTLADANVAEDRKKPAEDSPTMGFGLLGEPTEVEE